MTRFFVDKVISQSEDIAISLPALWRPLFPSRSRDVSLPEFACHSYEGVQSYTYNNFTPTF